MCDRYECTGNINILCVCKHTCIRYNFQYGRKCRIRKKLKQASWAQQNARRVLGGMKKKIWGITLYCTLATIEKPWIILTVFRVNTKIMERALKNILPQCGQYSSTGWNACSISPWSRKPHIYWLLKLHFITLKLQVPALVNDLTPTFSTSRQQKCWFV